PQTLGRLLHSHIASAFQQNIEETGVKFALGTTDETVSKINHGEDTAVTMANGQTVVADIVISEIGLHPNHSLYQCANIQTSLGVITN
ncbi:FAD-dependent oxidoreductase, partial [Acinetobacter baumannii]|uniref:FAD-dependent oxidoreductase n=1 Tax=Acinetobacter baumannii TaxID=470 RepID=UPI000AD6187A